MQASCHRSLLAFSFVLGSIPAIGAISPDHPELLQQGILQAYASGASSVVIPAGVYLIPPLSNGRHLDLENMSNFEIDARGATLLFQDVIGTGIIFVNCTNVNFHGATIAYSTTPFSQGIVQAVAADGSSIDVVIDAGYPTNLDNPKYFNPALVAHLLDSKTRVWKRSVYGDVYGTGFQRLSTNSFRLLTTGQGGAAAGDLIGIRAGTGDHAIRVVGCSRMILADLVINNSPNFAIAESRGGTNGQNQYNNIQVTRGPRPAGAAADPLFSTTADGIHSTESRQGPLIQNCTLAYMPDDAIAVHGHFSWVIAASGNNLIVSNTSVESRTNFNVGDTLRLLDDQNAVVGDAIVTAVVALPNYQNSRKSARTTLTDFTVGPYYQITLDRTLPAAFDYLAANPAASGAGFALRNNTIYYNRERGMNLKADNGLVVGNTITGSTVAGIRLGPEYYWSESGFSRGVTVQNNTISDTGYWGGQTAALLVSPDSGAPVANGFQNITIDGNTFTNIDSLPLFISSASALSITNNTFRNVLNNPPYAPYYLGQDVPSGLIAFVTASTGVRFSGNTFSQLGPRYTSFLAAASSDIQGATYLSLVAGSGSGFSGVQGANHWYYGYFPAGDLNNFTKLPVFNASASRWQHASYGPPWTQLTNNGAHPNGVNDGTEEWAVRRWVSTVSGNGYISGHVAMLNPNASGKGVFARVYLNAKLIYEYFLSGTDSAGTDYSFATAIQTGDTLDFAVAPNGSDSFDSTQFSGSISSITGTLPFITAVANSAGGQIGASPGAYVSIYGVNFAPPGFLDTWSKAIVNGQLPVSLNQVSVTVGGVPAYPVAITPGQINVLAAQPATGLSPVVVTTAAGSSAPFNTVVQAVQPALFLWPGSQPVATRTDYTWVARAGTFSAPTTPAKPGETIVLWSAGLGTTTPPAPSGQIVPPSAFTVPGVQVTLGGQTLITLGAALTPGLAGVYQIAAQLPSSLSDGDYPLIVAVAGVSSPSGVTLSVRNE